jgi:FG-GAP repeat protein/flagellar hook capping protein FlgD/VCBS repeat protein
MTRVRIALMVVIASALLPPHTASALSSRNLFIPVGTTIGDAFGTSVASAGDFDGDGYSDLVIGAPKHDLPGLADAGAAYLYYGGPAADATPDLNLGAGNAAGDFFGTSVAGAGDFNGDGYDDVIVGVYGSDAAGAGAGQAIIYFGTRGGAPQTLVLNGAPGDLFGLAVAGAGDVNGDGYDDVIVGGNQNGGGSTKGVAYIFYGGSSPNAVADVTLNGFAIGDLFGSAVGSAGDVNRDGYADVIVGAYGNGAGSAFIYFGGPAMTSSSVTLNGEAVGDAFGIAVGTAKDFNGDGYDDVIVGAIHGGSNYGRAYIYYGGVRMDSASDVTFTGPLGTGAANFGLSVAGAGDVNGDGYDDVVVGQNRIGFIASQTGRAYLFLGGSAPDAVPDLDITGTQSNEFVGGSVAGAGDVDGDGYDDLILGANQDIASPTAAGKAYVVSIYPYQVESPNGGETWVAGRPATVRWRGHDIADLSISFDAGASYTTLERGVGSEEENELQIVVPSIPTSQARVRLTYTGQTPAQANSDASDRVFSIVEPNDPPSAASRVQITPTGAANDLYGWCVARAGDVNGDGYDDLIVGARYAVGGAGTGRAYVYYGGPGADAIADLTLTGEQTGDFFGTSVAGGADVNGDGYDDVIVGALGNDAAGQDAGRAYVYFGGSAPDAVADLTLSGAAAGDAFGIAVAGGDVNGDGFADVIIGANTNDAGGVNAGRAYVYYGGTVPDTTPDLILTGAAGDDRFGSSVACVGDVNGDRFQDVVVGAYQNDAGGSNAGRAYVYYGGRTPDAVADLVWTGQTSGEFFGASVSGAGDVDGDGYDDVIVGASLYGGNLTGRAYLFRGGPGAATEPDLIISAPQTGAIFGVSVSSAGDVNADGYDDILVGAYYWNSQTGQAYLFYGGPGMDAVPDMTFSGSAANDRFGESVSGAGDFNGDGYPDIVVGAPQYGGPSFFGRVYLYDVKRYQLLSPNGGETWNVGATKSISWLGAEAADVWLSTDGGGTQQLLQAGVGGRELNTFSWRVPHTPTKFARLSITPANSAIRGSDQSDSLFTIQTSVALLSMLAAPLPEGGASIRWNTDPGPSDLAGYRLEHARGGSDWSTLVALTPETSATDPQGGPGMRYRLFAINGFGEELLLGETAIRPNLALSAWPLPYRGGALHISFATAGGLGGGAGSAEVAIFDITGRLVRRIATGHYTAGYQETTWDGLDARGRKVAAGIYFLRSVQGREARTVRLAVVR